MDDTKLRKVLIPAAGRGTRFLPATKSVPKEMLPILDRPLIQYSVEEAVAAGFDHVVLVTAEGKEATEKHFSPSAELERALRDGGKGNVLREVQRLADLVKMTPVLQDEPRGVGHAVLVAREAVGDEPFAVAFPDDFILSKTPVLQQLREVHEEKSGLVLAVERVPSEEISLYGVVKAESVGNGLYRVEDLVEKPDPSDAPSDLAIVGRYILDPALFDWLSGTSSGIGGEIQLTDAVQRALSKLPCHALVFEGRRYDCGNKLGFLQATVATALCHPVIGPLFRNYLGSCLE